MDKLLDQLPRDLKEIQLLDGRPAYIFIPYDGIFPTYQKRNDGKLYCPYCGRELENEKCDCYAFKKISTYNKQVKQG